MFVLFTVSTSTVTVEKPLYGVVGVYVPLAVIFKVVVFNSTLVPVTPKIVTPFLIFPALILESMAEVTALTVTGE